MPKGTGPLPTCTIQRDHGEFCDLPQLDDAPFPICAKHVLKLWEHYEGMGEGEREALARLGGLQDRSPRGWQMRNQQNKALRAYCNGQSVVYAVQFPDGIIKIGCTGDLATRLSAFQADKGALLGFRFGEYEDEQALHASLKAHVARGREWYHPAPEVLAVVNDMRTAFNLPPIAA